jgi:hypothetical protein
MASVLRVTPPPNREVAWTEVNDRQDVLGRRRVDGVVSLQVNSRGHRSMRSSCAFQFFTLIHLRTEPRESSMITVKLCTRYRHGRQTHNPSSERTKKYRQEEAGLDLLAIIGFYALMAVLSLCKKNVVTKQGNLTAIDGWRSSNWIRFVAAKVRASHVSILS